MPIFGILSIAILTAVSIAVLYLYLLALVGIIGRKIYPKTNNRYDYLVLIPAHDEGKVIGKTLEHLKKLRPSGKLEIAVIADNCTDSTAEIADGYGITVHERIDADNRGKGYALEWAIKLYNLDDFDAVVVVDADTIVQENMLEVMSQSFDSGAGAVQLYYGFSIEQKTALSYLQKIANIVENKLFYKPRAILGLPILLRGTGMAIKSKVLKNHPWNSHSITEDVEFAVNLIREGYAIDFNTNSEVYAAATSSYEQSQSQKMRWAAGTFELIKNYFLKLLKDGFTNARSDLIELGLSFLILSRPMLVYIVVLGSIFALCSQQTLRWPLVYWGLILIGLLSIYMLSGIVFIKEKYQACRAMVQIPKYAVWFLAVQVKALMSSGKLGWKRTERKVDE